MFVPYGNGARRLPSIGTGSAPGLCGPRRALAPPSHGTPRASRALTHSVHVWGQGGVTVTMKLAQAMAQGTPECGTRGGSAVAASVSLLGW